MEEKKEIKISLSTFFLIIAIIAILIMGYFLYMSNSKTTDMIAKEKELNAKIENLENKALYKNENIENNVVPEKIITENNTEISKMSFSDLMDMMYTKNKTKIGENFYDSSPSEFVSMNHGDASGNIIDVEYTSIYIYDEEINFNMNKVGPDKKISTTIKGIAEEVVSIKILQVEGGATPSVVYFLTRVGNVYYIDESMINSNNFTAQKLTDLKEIVSIEIAETTYPDAMEISTTLIATTYNGEKIDVFK